MCGTIFRLQPKPGCESDVVALTEAWTRRIAFHLAARPVGRSPVPSRAHC